MEFSGQMSTEDRIVKLLDVSMLSDTTYIGEEQDNAGTGGGCGGGVAQQDVACSTPAVANMSATKTPQSKRPLTRSSTSSLASASVSVYEDALAELSSTKTPVLPTRSRATPLRTSARKAAETNGDWLIHSLPHLCESDPTYSTQYSKSILLQSCLSCTKFMSFI